MKRSWLFATAFYLCLLSTSAIFAQQNNRQPPAGGQQNGNRPNNNQLNGNQQNQLDRFGAPRGRENELNRFGADRDQRNTLDRFGADRDQRNRFGRSGAPRHQGDNPNQAQGDDNQRRDNQRDEPRQGNNQQANDLLNGSGGIMGSQGTPLSGEDQQMQSFGEYNRNSADAARSAEEARAMSLENDRSRLKTYFELKRLNKEQRAAGAHVLSKETLDDWNRQDMPKRMSALEYSSDTGRIRWPAVLQAHVFEAHRLEVSDLFARRTASEFGVNSDFCRAVQYDTKAMGETLKAYLQSQHKFFTDQEYTAAQSFLQSLAFEARQAPDLEGMVAE